MHSTLTLFRGVLSIHLYFPPGGSDVSLSCDSSVYHVLLIVENNKESFAHKHIDLELWVGTLFYSMANETPLCHDKQDIFMSWQKGHFNVKAMGKLSGCQFWQLRKRWSFFNAQPHLSTCHYSNSGLENYTLCAYHVWIALNPETIWWLCRWGKAHHFSFSVTVAPHVKKALLNTSNISVDSTTSVICDSMLPLHV